MRMKAMTRQRLVISFGTVALLTCVGVVIVAKLRDPWGVRLYNQVRLGMTLHEVKGVIELPPGDYCTRKTGSELGMGTRSGPFGFTVRETGLREESLPPGSAKK